MENTIKIERKTGYTGRFLTSFLSFFGLLMPSSPAVPEITALLIGPEDRVVVFIQALPGYVFEDNSHSRLLRGIRRAFSEAGLDPDRVGVAGFEGASSFVCIASNDEAES